MEEYLKIKINLKISGPINFSKTFIIDYEKLKDVTFIGNDSIYGLIGNLNALTDKLGQILTSFEYYGFNIDYKQNK